MKEKVYLAILTATIKAPRGYKPRMIYNKCGFILASKKTSVLDKIKKEQLERMKKIVSEHSPNVKFSIELSFEIITLDGISAQYITPLNNN